MFYQDQWGTVCDNDWSIEEANVVCRQLGYPSASRAWTNASLGQGAGPISLSGVECNGTEASIAQCTVNYGNSHDCNHAQDVGVTCGDILNTSDSQGMSVSSPLSSYFISIISSAEKYNSTLKFVQFLIDYIHSIVISVSVRLVNGIGPHEGRVEVYYKCFWGTICAQDRSEWTLRDANVICRQLGYPSAIQAWTRAHFGEGFGPILLERVTCNGSESSIEECGHSGWFDVDCRHNQDVGVTCATEEDDTKVQESEIVLF